MVAQCAMKTFFTTLLYRTNKEDATWHNTDQGQTRGREDGQGGVGSKVMVNVTLRPAPTGAVEPPLP